MFVAKILIKNGVTLGTPLDVILDENKIVMKQAYGASYLRYIYCRALGSRGSYDDIVTDGTETISMTKLLNAHTQANSDGSTLAFWTNDFFVSEIYTAKQPVLGTLTDGCIIECSFGAAKKQQIFVSGTLDENKSILSSSASASKSASISPSISSSTSPSSSISASISLSQSPSSSVSPSSSISKSISSSQSPSSSISASISSSVSPSV